MQLKDMYKNKIVSFLSVLLIYGGMVLLFGCPIKFLTGVSCPACGITRAWCRVLCGDITGAFYYHPLFWLGPMLLGIIYLEGIRSWSWSKIVLMCLGVLFFLVYFLRMFVFKNEVVTIELDQNIFLKGYRWIDHIIKHIKK